MIKSAGILLYRNKNKPEFFLVHPGGPFWANKDLGVWSIPKGEFTEEDPLAAALREFKEETGIEIQAVKFIGLQPVKMKSGKLIFAWAAEGDIDPVIIKSNMFEMVFKNGSKASFPEIDKGGWFNEEEAMEKLIPVQTNFIKELVSILIR